MAKITVTCPKCSAQYSIEDTYVGKTGHCKKCGTHFALEASEAGLETRVLETGERDALRQAASPPRAEGPSAEVWNVGDVILDVYEVKAINGGDGHAKHYAEGGMGFVYRVHHRGWDLDLAVKSPKLQCFETEQGKRDFERECKTWIELGLHPNIVTCYYVRRVDGIPRVFAEFVEGGNLEDWFRRGTLYEGGPPASLRRILDIAIQFGWGLHYAHEQGLIHQDVKPGNVMMQGDVPKVTDFGLAKAREAAARVIPDATQASMVVSWGGMTPAYCSPEQVKAAVEAESGVPSEERTQLTRRTDIWSWALTVFAMFCGKAPCRYGGQTAPDVFKAFLERPSEDKRLPPMPEDLVFLLKQCFRKNPEARPQTMREVVEDLKDVYRRAGGQHYPRQEPVTTELRANSLNNRAASLLDLGRQKQALKLLDEAWQRHPWQPQVTHNRGLVLWRAGKTTDTDLITELEELCKTRGQDWAAAYSLGLAQLERGEVKLAEEALTQAAALGGGDEVHAALEETRSRQAQAPRCVRSFTGQPPFVTTVFLSADARWALSGIDQRKLRLWDVANGRSAFTFEVPNERASRSPDGRWELSAGKHGSLRLTDATQEGRGQTFREITWGSSPASCFVTADGRWQVTQGEHYTLELHAADTGELVRTFRGHAGPVSSVCFSDDGRWALSGSRDKTLRLWEVATGRCIRTLKGHTDPINTVFLGPKGDWALSASTGKRLRLWDLRLVCGTRRFTAPILLCHVTSSEEAGRAQARFADLCQSARAAVARGRYAVALELVRTARALPGYEVAKASLDLWDEVGRHGVRRAPRDAWCVQTLEGHADDVRSVALTADARRALSGGSDRTVRLWELDAGRCVRTFNGHTDSVRSVSLTPDAHLAVSGGWDRTLRVWDVATGECLRTLEGHANYVNAVVLSPNGRRAFSGSWDKTLKLWHVPTGRCLQTFQGHDNYVDSVWPSLDGRLVLSGSEDNTLRLWEVAAGRCLRCFEGHTDWVQSVFLSSDGRWALSGSKDWSVRLWDTATGGCQDAFEGHTAPVNSVFLSRDGLWALSGGRDKTMRLWEVATGQCRHVFEGHTSQVTSVFLSPDSRFALSGGEDGTLRLWQLDWDYEFPGWADWDERARPHLETFLSLCCPYTPDHLTRADRPQWNDDDFARLLLDLQNRGLGWLRPEGVRSELERMTAEWQGPRPLPGE
jgi:WD40 repeat protein/serine/threonine protein kinase